MVLRVLVTPFAFNASRHPASEVRRSEKPILGVSRFLSCVKVPEASETHGAKVGVSA